MKRFFAILCVLMTLFLVGCKAETQISGKPVETGKPTETTNSTADDDKYYDDEGKIILTPINDEKDKKKDEIDKQEKTEKADFSGSGTIAQWNAAVSTGVVGSAHSAEYLFNNQSSGMAPSQPKTIAGVIYCGQLHYQMFKDHPASGNPKNSSGNLRCDAASNGAHSGVGHKVGLAADIWSNQIIHPAIMTIAHPNSLETEANLNSSEYGPYIKNKIKYIDALKKSGIRVVDEVVDIGSKDSDGPHLHVEFGDFVGGGLLADLFDGLKNIGDILSVIINKFTDVAATAYSTLFPYVVPLLWLLAIIDICLTIMLSGMEISLFQVIVPKILKYCAIYGVLVLWPDFINAAITTSTEVSGMIDPSHMEDVAQNISQPQLVMQKGFHLIRPGIDFVSNLSFDKFIVNLFPCLLIVISGLIAMAALMMIAIYVTVIYIEFFVGAGLSVFLLPFSAIKYVKFLAEGASSWLINNAFRLTTLSIMIGMVFASVFKSATNSHMVKTFNNIQLAFKSQSWLGRVLDFTGLGKLAEGAKAIAERLYGNENAFSETVTAQLGYATASYMSLCALIVFLCYLVYRVTESIYNHIVATIEIPD